MQFEPVTYRPVLSRVLAGVTVVICALGVASFLWLDAAAAVRGIWPLLLVAVLAWALFWRPMLIVEEHGITVVNVLQTHFVPWPAIERLDTRFSLTLYSATRKIPVWVSPAPGRHRVLGLSRADFTGVGESARGEHGSLRPGDAVSTPSGNLAQLIRGHWERLRDAGMFDRGVDPEAATVTWHGLTIAVVVALVAASAAGLVL